MTKIFKTVSTLVIAGALSVSMLAISACDEDTHTHTYGDAVWTWASDYSSATATFACTDGDDTQQVTASVTSQTTAEATCTTAGEVTYTATATFGGKTFTDTKTDEIAAAGHTYGSATYDSTADKWYETCSDCGNVTTTEVTDTSNYIMLADTSAALTAALAEGGNIKLTANIVADSDSVYTDSSFYVSNTAILNLNGYNITSAANDLSFSENESDGMYCATISVKDGGNLTVNSDGIIDNINDVQPALYCSAGGTVTLNGGTYTRSNEGSSGYFHTILNQGTMTINEGVTVSSPNGEYSSLIYNGGMSKYEYTRGDADPILTINGGTFYGGYSNVNNGLYGELIINGGSFSATTQSAVYNTNIAEINGGEFDASQAKYILVDNYGNDTYEVGKLTIKGGTFTGGTSSIIYTESYGATVAISGGTFAVADGASFVLTYDSSCTISVTITGGTFNIDPASYVSTDDYSITSGNGYYVVTAKS